jgi:hypothetical protein
MNKADHYPITRSLAYLALTVPDLPAAIEEAQEINGLHLVGCSADTACLTSGERKFELLLRSGAAACIIIPGRWTIGPSSNSWVTSCEAAAASWFGDPASMVLVTTSLLITRI